MNLWVTVHDCADLPGFPATPTNIRIKLEKLSAGTKRKKAGSKAWEYPISCLPPEAQAVINKKQLTTVLETKSPISVNSKNSKTELEIIRQCPALLESNTAELSQNQRNIADARCALSVAVLRLEERGMPRYKAVQFISDQSRTESLPAELQSLANIANAKKGKRIGVGARMLHEWVLNYVKASDGAERLFLLAPGQNKVKPVESISWLPDYLAIYRDPRGFNMKQAYRIFCGWWAEKYQGQDNALHACPSYESVRRAMDKLPVLIKQKYRVTGSAWRALNPYVQRDWSQMPVNGVWVGDGHNLKMDVAHPIHGRPFSPEITLILDARTRFIVGWSLSLSENAVAVADALRHAMETNGRPLIYYSDNGGGEKNKMLDADITGILTRLGVDHPTGIPGNPQGRGIIERLNKEVPNTVARHFDTYHGTGADSETVRVIKRSAMSAINALTQGKALSVKQQNALNKLPSWNQLIDAITSEVEKYNTQHEHRSLPKVNGKHITPAAYRRYLIENENHEIDYLSDVELRDMFRPQVIRVVERGQVQLFNNVYFALELAQYHKDEVAVSYDIHNPQAVIVRDLSGSLICKAVWNGNSRDAFPKAVIKTLQEKRAQGRAKRAQTKIDEAMAELNPVIESNANAFDFGALYQPQNVIEHEPEPIYYLDSDRKKYLDSKKIANG